LLRDAPLKQVPPGAEASSPSAKAGEAAATGVHSNIVLPSDMPLGVWNFDLVTDKTQPFETRGRILSP